jgi:hypothetical protein
MTDFAPTYIAEDGTPIRLVGSSWIEPTDDPAVFRATSSNGAVIVGSWDEAWDHATANQRPDLFATLGKGGV